VCMMRTLGSGSLPEVLGSGSLPDAQVVAGAVRLSGRSGTAEDLLPKYLATCWLQATDGAVTATILAGWEQCAMDTEIRKILFSSHDIFWLLFFGNGFQTSGNVEDVEAVS